MNYIPQKFQVKVRTNNHLSLLFLGWAKEKSTCDIPMCHNPASPHHLIIIGSGGDRKKPMINHFGIVRTCTMPHHADAHNLSDSVFQARYGVNLWEIGLKNLMEFNMKLANGQLDKKYFEALKIQYEEV